MKTIIKITTLCIIFGLFTIQNTFAKPLQNQLVSHASPYLAMHGPDPVQWQDWSEDVVKRAQKENKLIYISSGYFSCHWCHVMQRESYKDKVIAKILNQYFIPVKVDRELNPALDARLIDFVERTQGQAGWPLNVFITPEGYPLVGMTYVPAENFTQVLNNLKQQWEEKKPYLKSIAKQATAQLLRQQQSTSVDTLPKDAVTEFPRQFLLQTADIMDEIQGGFGDQNKFPSPPQLIAILNILKDKKIKPYLISKWSEFLITTLDNMAQLGLRDQINGGFFRYTVDPNWQIPHFEKMLYDNAQLASLYFKAGEYFNRPDYNSIAIDTLRFLQTDMNSNIGVISASLSAVDDKGVEGGCYVWQQGDLKKYLTPQQYNVASQHWKLINNEKLESGYHLIQVKSVNEIASKLKIKKVKVHALIVQARKKLKSIRNLKPCPIDTKPVAAWLGLALEAFTLGAKNNHPTKDSFQATADEIYNFIQTDLWNTKKQTLQRSIKKIKGKSVSIGFAGLEDYALVAKSVAEYARLKHKSSANTLALQIARQAWKRFYNEGKWYLTETPLIKYVIGKPVLVDSPLPSPSATLIQVSLELKDKKLNALANAALQQGADKIQEAPYWYASQIDVIRQFR